MIHDDSRASHDIRLIWGALALSALVHLVCALPLDFFNPFQLRDPVQRGQLVVIDLREPAPNAQVDRKPPLSSAVAASPVEGTPGAGERRSTSREEEPPPEPATTKAAPRPPQDAALNPSPAVAGPEGGAIAAEKNETSARVQGKETADPVLLPVRRADEFMADDRELLAYRISMMGISVGSAELKAEKKNGELRITLHVRSNAAFSQIYPVDDSVETRHIGGNFILSRIRQREGAFIGDKGFTLFLRDKKVFWIDRLKNTSISEPLPDSSVVDILSGLYYLRNRPLEVGKDVVLQLFDGNRYLSGTVVVLGKEHLTLPGLREVDTLLIRPQFRTDGLFRSTGEILVWVTDDRNRVPVKVETRIALGKVTAELVAAESQRAADGVASDAAARTTARSSGQ